MTDITGLGFQVARVLMARLSEPDVQQIYAEHVGRPYFPQLVRHMTSDAVVGIEVAGPNAVNAMQVIAGPTNPQQAKQQSPQSWRARFGSEGVQNAVHISADETAYARESSFFFSHQMRISGFTAVLNNCSLCLVKPHVTASGLAGQVVDRILEEGFEVSAMASVFLNRKQAEEFLDLYRGVLPEFEQSVD